MSCQIEITSGYINTINMNENKIEIKDIHSII